MCYNWNLLVNRELLVKSRFSGMGAEIGSCLWFFFQHDFQPCSEAIKSGDTGNNSTSSELVVIVLSVNAVAPLEQDWSIPWQWSLCIVSFSKCNSFLLSCPFWWVLLCWILLHYIIVLKYLGIMLLVSRRVECECSVGFENILLCSVGKYSYKKNCSQWGNSTCSNMRGWIV